MGCSRNSSTCSGVISYFLPLAFRYFRPYFARNRADLPLKTADARLARIVADDHLQGILH
jgi:hypothetical protein